MSLLQSGDTWRECEYQRQGESSIPTQLFLCIIMLYDDTMAALIGD